MVAPKATDPEMVAAYARLQEARRSHDGAAIEQANIAFTRLSLKAWSAQPKTPGKRR